MHTDHAETAKNSHAGKGHKEHKLPHAGDKFIPNSTTESQDDRDAIRRTSQKNKCTPEHSGETLNSKKYNPQAGLAYNR